MEQIIGKILKVSGPLVVAEGMKSANMFDVVRVGEKRLIGEIIEMHGDRASIQVYEETAGLGRGDTVVSTGEPLSAELGPGLIGNIYDGIQRPLEAIREKAGANLTRGIDEPAITREKLWVFSPAKKIGDTVRAGDVLGYVDETASIKHKIMVPPKMSGKIVQINSGEMKVLDTAVKILLDNGKTENVSLVQKWPVRIARPFKEKLPPSIPM
ncbi:MAG: V-type ATP synthase subunit A, partial [Clostridia bacterium]|nr:V-type ATP synthase subunit A [Clostridia bacterium]